MSNEFYEGVEGHSNFQLQTPQFHCPMALLCVTVGIGCVAAYGTLRLVEE